MLDWLNVPTQSLLLVGALALVLLLVLRYRRAPFGSLGSQLLLAFSGVATISLALTVGAFIWQTRVILTNQVGEASLALTRSESQRLVEQLEREVAQLQNLAEDQTLYNRIVTTSSARLGTLSPKERAAQLHAIDDDWVNQSDQVLRDAVLDNLASIELNNFALAFPAHTQLALTDFYGRLAAAGGDTPEHYYYGEEVWWSETWNEGGGNIYVGSPILAAGQQTTTIEIAVPVYLPPYEGEEILAAEKVAVGALRSRFVIRNLQVFAETSPRDESSELYLVDGAGLVLYSSNLGRVGIQLADDFQTNISNLPFNWGVRLDETGQNVIYSHALLTAPEQPYLDILGWAIVVQQDEAKALVTVGHLSQIALLGGLLALTLAVTVGNWIARRLTRPIEDLTEIASGMAGGQLERAAPVSGPTELRALAQAFNSMTIQLGQTLATLEQRVAARTQDLEQRSRYLEAAAQVGRTATSILDADQLIQQVVDLILERFNLYYVGLFLVDPAGEWAMLRAGTGEAGQVMLSRGHQIRVGEGMIGWSIAHAQARVALEAGEDAVRLATAELPETRSEAAIPLRSRGQILGALTVQDSRPGAFDQDTIAALQTMADQVAMAISNAQLFEQAQEGLDAERRAYGELSRQSWAGMVRARPLGYRYDQGSVTPIARHPDSHAERRGADSERRPESDLGELGRAIKELPELVLPVQVREQVIGTITAHKPDAAGEWTEEEVSLIKALMDQSSVALENARLFREARQRLAELDTLQRTSLQLVSSLDLPSVLDTIVENALNVVDATHCHIYLYDKARQAFIYGSALQRGGIKQAVVPSPRRDGFTAAVLHEGRSIIINDAPSHPLYANVNPLYQRVQAIAGFPIKWAERMLGVFTITFLEPHVFSETEMRVLGLLVDQAAIAVENARLFQDTQRRVAREQMVGEITTRLRGSLDIDTILQTAVREMRETLDLAEVQVRMGSDPVPAGLDNGRQVPLGPAVEKAGAQIIQSDREN